MDKENTITLVLTFFILFICYKMYKESEVFNLKCIISGENGKEYCVRSNRTNSKEATELLAKINLNCDKLIEHLKKYDDNPAFKRLIDKYPDIKIRETLPTSKLVAYSENKGEVLAFCLNADKNNNAKLIDEDTLMFVALHELSHVMSISIGHNKEFWDNFKSLIIEAKKINIYHPVNYKNNNVNYCGMKIKDSPYYDKY